MEKAKRGGVTLKDNTAHPVAGWAIGPVMSAGAIFIRLDYLTAQTPHPDRPTMGVHCGLTIPQARELIAALASTIQLLESGGTQSPPGPRH